MKNRIAQITLFIILGLLLFFIVGIGFYFVGNIKGEKAEEISKKVQQINLEAQPIKSYIDTCLKGSSITGAYRLGLQGGYYILPMEFLDTGYVTLPYYYFKGKNLIPSKELIERELAGHINNELGNCIDFSIFKVQGFNISNKNPKAKVSISNDKTLINLNFPLVIKKEGLTQELQDFSYELPIRLGHIHDISKDLVDKIVKEPYYIDITFLLSQDLDVSTIHFDQCNDIYAIIDNNSKNSYLYLFAVKLDDKYCKFEINETIEQKPHETIVENNPPILASIDYSNAYVNKTFVYNVNASDSDNDKVFFLDNTDLFHIHPLFGTINFTPKTGQEGLYKINITVVDIKGGIDSQWFYLEIK